MRLWIQEYGRIVSSLLVSLLILAVIYGVFVSQWQRVGGVEDSVKTNFQSNEPKRTPPEITARDFKVRRGMEISFRDHVSAVDFDGRDLGEYLAFYPEVREGERWGQAGIFYYEIRVKSPVTQKRSSTQIMVLVDGTIEGGDS